MTDLQSLELDDRFAPCLSLASNLGYSRPVVEEGHDGVLDLVHVDPHRGDRCWPEGASIASLSLRSTGLDIGIEVTLSLYEKFVA